MSQSVYFLVFVGNQPPPRPAWHDIPQNCLGTVEDITNGQFVKCLPIGKPSGCPQKTWDQVSSAFIGTVDSRYTKFEGKNNTLNTMCHTHANQVRSRLVAAP